VDIALMSFDSAFLPWDEKQAIVRRAKEEIRKIEAPRAV
jgi:hypothetical protein